MKIRPTGAELFHVDGRTDRHDEVNNSFSQFCGCAQKVASEGSRMWRVLANLVNCFLLSNGLSPGFQAGRI